MFLAFAGALEVCAQEAGLSHDMAFYADVMVNARQGRHRAEAAGVFDTQFTRFLEEGNYTAGLIDSISGVRRLFFPDSARAIITWGVENEVGKYHYGGFIAGPEGIEVRLEDRRTLNSQYAAYTPETWYGAIYYGLLDFKLEDGRNAYILLGFDANDRSTNKRVAEILLFESEQAQFGWPLFPPPDSAVESEPLSRIVIEYADAASGTMQFDREKGMIIYDNVILIQAGPEGLVQVPDGSYRAYQLEDSSWRYIDKVFNLIMDSPPGAGLPPSDRDIIGRKKN